MPPYREVTLKLSTRRGQRKQMNYKTTLLLLAVALMLGCSGSPPTKKFNSVAEASSSISVGMDKEAVVEKLGTPDKTDSTTNANGEPKETLFYYDPVNREKILTVVIVSAKVIRIGQMGQ